MRQALQIIFGVPCFCGQEWKYPTGTRPLRQSEREELHKYIATRFAYTAAGTLLLLATILQALSHTLDPWLPTVLAGMVLAKIIGRWYAQKKY